MNKEKYLPDGSTGSTERKFGTNKDVLRKRRVRLGRGLLPVVKRNGHTFTIDAEGYDNGTRAPLQRVHFIRRKAKGGVKTGKVACKSGVAAARSCYRQSRQNCYDKQRKTVEEALLNADS